MTCEHPDLTPPRRVQTNVADLKFGDEVNHPGYGRIVVETVTPLLTGDIEILFRKKHDGRAFIVTFTNNATLDVIA